MKSLAAQMYGNTLAHNKKKMFFLQIYKDFKGSTSFHA